MQNQPIKTIHPLMLTAVTILTVFSIIGTAAITGLIPLSEKLNHSIFGQHEAVQKSRQTPDNENNLPAADTGKEFRSVVQPVLSSCFNCGEVIAIEAVGNIEASDLQLELGLHEEYDNYASSSAVDELNMPDSAIDQIDGEINQEIYSTTNSFLDMPIKNQVADNAITYLIKVRMQDGTHHIITQDTPPEQAIGDKIRVSTEKLITA